MGEHLISEQGFGSGRLQIFNKIFRAWEMLETGIVIDKC